MKKNMYSTQEVANILHLSRVEIFRRIKSGKIKAEKIGRNYVIPYESIEEVLGTTIGTHKRREIEKVIDKALKEYGEAFKKLSKE
jgi:excisionase family DNA binding protein